MNERTKEDWKKLFDSYDRNLDNAVSRDEIQKLMCYCGFCPTEEELKEMTIKESNTIDFEEFYNFVIKQKDPFGELKDAFDVFDKNKDGSIDIAEFRKILQNGDTATDEEIENLIKLVDDNNDGKLQYEEFINIWTNCS